MNEIVNKFLLAGDKFIPEKHLNSLINILLHLQINLLKVMVLNLLLNKMNN